MKNKETLEEAAVRELAEETSLVAIKEDLELLKISLFISILDGI